MVKRNLRGKLWRRKKERIWCWGDFKVYNEFVRLNFLDKQCLLLQRKLRGISIHVPVDLPLRHNHCNTAELNNTALWVILSRWRETRSRVGTQKHPFSTQWCSSKEECCTFSHTHTPEILEPNLSKKNGPKLSRHLKDLYLANENNNCTVEYSKRFSHLQRMSFENLFEWKMNCTNLLGLFSKSEVDFDTGFSLALLHALWVCCWFLFNLLNVVSLETLA